MTLPLGVLELSFNLVRRGLSSFFLYSCFYYITYILRLFFADKTNVLHLSSPTPPFESELKSPYVAPQPFCGGPENGQDFLGCGIFLRVPPWTNAQKNRHVGIIQSK